MGFLGQMGEDEPLPGPGQVVLRTGGGDLHPAAQGQRLQQQMDLGIVPQGLVVPHSLHRPGDGLPVDDAPRPKLHLEAEPVSDEPLQDFRLDLAHEPHMDLPQTLVPLQVELRVLLGELPEPGQHPVRVGPLRQDHLIGKGGLQGRRGPGPLGPQSLSGVGGGGAH